MQECDETVHSISKERDLLVSVVVEKSLEWVEGQVVSAVIINGLQGREGEEDQGTTVTHAAEKEGQRGSNTVHQEALKGMVVKGAKRVGDIETVMARVEVLVKIWNVVEEAVEEVLPCVEEAHGDKEADAGLDVKVGDVSHGLDGSLGDDSLESCKGDE